MTELSNIRDNMLRAEGAQEIVRVIENGRDCGHTLAYIIACVRARTAELQAKAITPAMILDQLRPKT